MWLFDNIFLDEDAVNATVMDKPIEEKQELENATTPAEAIAPPSMEDDPKSEILPEKLDSSAKEQEISTPIPEIDTGVSFDIGWDLNFWDVTIANPNEEKTNGASESISQTLETNPSQETPVSFSVNGVSYSTDGWVSTKPEPTNESIIQDSDNEVSQTSIAMIQWSTAATGISIIWSTPYEDGKTEIPATDEVTLDSPSNIEPEDTNNSLINILSDSIDVTESTMDKTSPEISVESTGEMLPIIDQDLSVTQIQEESSFSFPEKQTHLESAILPEVATVTELQWDTRKEEDFISRDTKNAPEAHKQDVPSYTWELATILDGFIKEMNEREREISVIIMKRHDLARRKVEIEEEHKTRMLALNMEDEFLKNKAERERAEQDRLQSVIKNFQKQIAKSE